METVDLVSLLIALAFLSMFVNGTVTDDNVEVISLNESQYCIVNKNTIRVSDNFTTELQDIINKTEHVIISTTINSTVIFIAPSNGSRCHSSDEDNNGISNGLFIILMVIYLITVLIAFANITLHVVFKELRTMAGVLAMAMCSVMIMVMIVSIIFLTYSFINDGIEDPTACVVLTSTLFYLILMYQASKLIIQFQFAYFMYKSYKLQPQDTIDKRCMMMKFVIFGLTLSMLCLLSAIVIDLAVTGQFYSKRNSLCFGRQFDLDNISVFRVVSIAEFALFVIIEIIVFSIGLILYFLVNKSCCKTLSTNFRITIALASTIGVAIILLIILNATETSNEDTLPVVSSGILMEQLLLFLLFVSSSRVRKGLRKIFVDTKSSTSPIQSKESTEEHHVGGVIKELCTPLVL